jgi:hypothetical protein
MRLRVLLLVLALAGRWSFAQPVTPAPPPASTSPPVAAPKSATPAKTSHSAATLSQMQTAVEQLTQSNRDLLDLLKKQQAVLEDIQFDRRLQSRQIGSLEERLEETLLQNAQLQSKIANLEATAAVAPPPSPPAGTSPATTAVVNPAPPVPAPVDETPPPPSTYLPAPDSEGAPGTKTWHRILTLKGDDGKNSDLFQIQGRTWRVLWHNQDKPGKAYQNTSALFINAFPKDDTIPQKVCSKLGSGGDSTELAGPGNYYLRIEASGGSWELAVEDFR